MLVGAFHGEQMIGFMKLVHGYGVSNLRQILSMISQCDKAPTHALVSEAASCAVSAA